MAQEEEREDLGRVLDASTDMVELREQVLDLRRQFASLVSRLEMSEREIEAEALRNNPGLGGAPNPENPWGSVRLPRGGWLQNPFQDLTYTDKTDKQNPIRFLKRFEKIADYEAVNVRDQLHYFAKCMKDRAATWFELQEVNNIREAKEAFKEQFWGDEAQARIRERLYTARYSVSSKSGTMAEYAMSLAHDAKLLEPPMSDYEVVRCVKRHFDREIMREIRSGTVTSIRNLQTLLEDIEINRDKVNEPDRLAKKTRAHEAAGRAQPLTGLRPYQGYEGRRPYRMDFRPGAMGYRPEGAEGARMEMTPRPRVELPESEAEREVIQGARTSEERGGRAERVASGSAIKSRTDVKGRWKISVIEKQPEDDSSLSDSIDQDEVDTLEVLDERGDSQGEINILRTKEILKELDQSIQEARSTSREYEPFVNSIIGEVKVRALIDTGAQVSAMTKGLFDDLTGRGVQINTIPIKRLALKGAFSEKGASVGYKAQMTLELVGRVFVQEFCIVPRMIHPLVLGVDFLSHYGATVRLEGEKLGLSFAADAKHMMRLESMSEREAQGELGSVLRKHQEIFENKIGKVNHYRHEIRLTSEMAYKSRTYPVPEVHRDKVRQYLMELEREGIIRKAPTQFVNPLVVVVKKTGKIRICLDARELNKRMVNDYAQPPSIEEVFRRIGCRKFFTTLDVSKAFWQIPLVEESEQYTGFLFDNQTYVFRRMPFGIKTAGASFARAMQLALGNECDNFVIAYLDDILIASHTFEEHIEHVNQVLGRLEKVGFRLNKSKCEFMRTEIKFLGHTFNEIEAGMNEETKAAVRNFQKPRNRRAIQSFLGLVNWDRRFIRNLATLTRPLENLLKKQTKFDWTSEVQVAFQEIKNAFAAAPTLFLVRPGFRFGVQVDAAVSGLGARLYQYDDKGQQFTIAYASRSLKGAESNYTITELECLALVWALRKWCALLMGCHVRVQTDHKALKFVSACVRSSARIARWLTFLQEFDLEIEHIPYTGKSNAIADVLSRRVGDAGGQAKLEAEKYIAFIIDPRQETDTRNWVELIGEAQNSDETMRTKIKGEPDRYFEREGLVRFRGEKERDKVVIPGSVAWKLLEGVHVFLLHFGTDKVIGFAKTYFEIENLDRLARDVVASCRICIATKYYTRPTTGSQYYELPDHPGQTVSIDIFGPLPASSKRNKYVVVLMDHFSKRVKFLPVRNQKLETIVRALEEKYLPEVGISKTFVSDREGQFVSGRWEQLGKEHRFSVRRTSAYNPQSNPVERVMRELGRLMRAYAHYKHTLWDRVLDKAEEIINGTKHRGTGYSSNELYEDRGDVLEIDSRLLPENPSGEDVLERIHKAKQKLKQRAEERRRQTEKHGVAPVYREGADVWVRLHRRSDSYRKVTRKLHLLYDGPHVIAKQIKPNAYLIARKDGGTLGVYNSRGLRPHREPMLLREDPEYGGLVDLNGE